MDTARTAAAAATARAARRAGSALRPATGEAQNCVALVSFDFSRSDGRAELDDDRIRPAETVAGFLAAASIAVSAVAMVYRPVRLAPIALIVAFIAVALSERHFSRLAAFAVAVGALGWLVGMTIAVLAEEPLY